MYDLIGRPYRLGADGSDPDRAIDCIHLVFEVLDRLAITRPQLDPAWYTASKRVVLKALSGACFRIERPQYDGDVVLLPHKNYAFGVTWQSGILYTAAIVERVNWVPFHALPLCRCYRSACFRTSAS